MNNFKLVKLALALTLLAGTGCYGYPMEYEQEKSWIQDHIWVPIVSSIVVLVLLICLCTCCCCGCCACCRSKPSTVVVQGGHTATSVAVANTTVMQANPHHIGYDQ
ncbi:hypothetical protein ACF0H5_011266 [Mactra antiquata]